MEFLPLLHKAPAVLGKSEQIPRLSKKHDSVPADWVPDDLRYEPAAFPTPFGRAEATRITLENLERSTNSERWATFRLLVLGLATGELFAEPFDLKNKDEYDNLGAALLTVDADARYLAWIRDRRSGQPFGVSFPDCLVWAHARREPAEWNELNERVRAREQQAMELLADFREALIRARRWRPESRSAGGAPWQIGIDRVIDKVTASADLHRLARARTTGPLRVRMPRGDGSSELVLAPIYLPQLAAAGQEEHDAFQAFWSMLGHDVRERAGVIEFTSEGRVLARIPMPAGSADASPLFLGMGSVEVVASAGESRNAPRLDELSRLLEPVRTELARAHVDTGAIGVAPLVPDALRFLGIANRRLADATEGWPAGCKFTVRAQKRLTLPNVKRPEPDGITAAAVTAPVAFGMLDKLGEHPVNDLRALGWVLFQVFVGERDSNTAAALISTGDRHPLEPIDAAYERVERAPDQPWSRRLGQFQRFVRSYADAATESERLLASAAASFARWAIGYEVAPLGRRGPRSVILNTPAGALALAIDPLR